MSGLIYKRIDFNFLIQGVTDVDRYMGGAGNPLWTNNAGDTYIKVEGRNDVWTPNNRNATFANWGAWNGTSKGITNAKYARLKSAELAYNFSGRMLKMMGLSSARLAFQGTNLFTYAPGFNTGDPENEPVSELGYQYNFQFYPLPKRYNVAFKINF